jgi:hypothetical protein
VRSVGYVVLIHARVALPTPDYPFLDSFLTEFSEVGWIRGISGSDTPLVIG